MSEAVVTKTLASYFADWEGEVFGFGYGSGEEHVLGALRAFFEKCSGNNGQYDFRELEASIGAAPTWFLINALGHADIIEYGTSPRFAWLTPQGVRLRDFVLAHSAEELVMLTVRDEDDVPCYRGSCNCDGPKCINPFWTETLPTPTAL